MFGLFYIVDLNVMWKAYKRIVVVSFAVGAGVLLSGCSLGGVQERIDGFVASIISKDQQKAQGFEVTRELVYESFDTSVGAIYMNDMGLTEVPDFCTLVDQDDHPRVIEISLQSNNIALAHQDLSCFENLEVINLSYNDLDAVSYLGELPQLKELYLHKNSIGSLRDIPEYVGLERLNVSYNDLKDLSGIESMTGLLTLEAAHNQLEAVVGVERLESLERLKVEFNKLRSIESIDELKNLELVTAKGNELQESVISGLESLNDEFRERMGNAAGNAGQEIINEIDDLFNSVLE